MHTQAEAVRLAIESMGAGGQAALARDLDVKPPTIAGWALPNGHPKFRPIPARYCLRIAALSGVSVKYLRPNDWSQLWPDLAGVQPTPKQEAAHG